MQKIERSRNEMFRRYVVFFFALFVMSLGVSTVTKSLLGTSPISSVPYVWSLNTSISMGTYIMILNALLILTQLLLLGVKGIKEFKVELLMQIPVSLLFGIFIDVTMWLLKWWTPEHYWQQIVTCLAGCCFMALGIAMEVVADVCMNSGEYVLQIASRKFKKEFGLMKISFDVTLLVIAIGCSWILAGNVTGIREGTVIVAIFTGPLVRLFKPHLAFIERWEEDKRKNKAKDSPSVMPLKGNMVITIGREYGSGGRDIGRKIAEKLGIAFYDNAMMEMVANESGLSRRTVMDYDQRLPHSLLYELITQDHNTPVEQSLSKKDALFVAQSRVIRRLASEGPCVIVGRCSDYVLRDKPDCLHIFLHASVESKIERATASYGVSADKAPAIVERTNAMRRNHYAYYTGKTWGDSRNYHAVFDTGRMSEDAVCNAVLALVDKSAT